MPRQLPDDDDHPTTSGKEYDDQITGLQYAMRDVALAYHRQGLRGIVVVEGTDTAGKGGAIRRLTAELDPRHYEVWPIGPPLPHERGQHYLERFWSKLPEPGTISIFDRSWYGRFLVERVSALVPEERWRAAYQEINHFEEALVDDGIRIIKVFLHVSLAEQRARLQRRATNPQKWWKISSADLRSHMAAETYHEATEDMLAETSPKKAPWCVIAADNKRHTRLTILRETVEHFSQGVDQTPTPPDSDLAILIRDVLGVEVPSFD
jgi:polyphosphate kinase 2 (PPK2 family)